VITVTACWPAQPGTILRVQLHERVASLLGTAVTRVESRGGAITGDRWRVELADGRAVFVKSRADAPEGFFAVEAAGLRWLADAAGGPRVPDVLGYDRQVLVLPWLPAGPPPDLPADTFGRELAALHSAGALTFGADRDGWIGAAPLDNRPCDSWPEFYSERRMAPYVRILRDRGDLAANEVAVFTRLAARLASVAGPAEPPARLHGDLWSGNLLWDPGGHAWLVDPAAHGGHRETDLAMLDLFGAPGLARLLAAYREVAPLSPGWADRRELHQVHPLLVHAVLFGGSYVSSALAAARRYAG
jgi:fructosamine-3-kinase